MSSKHDNRAKIKLDPKLEERLRGLQVSIQSKMGAAPSFVSLANAAIEIGVSELEKRNGQ